MCLVPFFCSSCSGISSNFNLATDQQETSFYSSEREERIGAAVARKFEEAYHIVEDVEMNQRLESIASRIFKVSDRTEFVYTARIIDREEVNAMALPGGYIYIFRGLMEYVEDDDALAAVVAHELGHICARHNMKRLEASYGSLAVFLAAIQTDSALAGGLNMAMQSMMIDYSQEDELKADELGLKYMRLAGFDPQGIIRMLETLKAYNQKQPIRRKYYGRTHPYIYQRIGAVNTLLNEELTIEDYVRMTGEDS